MHLEQVNRYSIEYTINQLAQAVSKLSRAPMTAAKYLLNYLAGTTNFGIVYNQGGFKLISFSDANWSNKPDNRKSTYS